ncbi:CheR family methyltransferase [Nitrosophilus kaiyonis]|uniref:CheR family methyltransferase n=1 Tax=Nitrosophilus kaiyonis TaxID=2930200 RepID=UPI0024924F81|nr:protein-glutamate O-methyltransferase CheR [Nitrosophilus kaiyonis]
MTNCLINILKLFKERTGIVFESRLNILEQKIIRFFKDLNFSNCELFYEELKSNDELFQYFTNFLTVSESYFYREIKHFEFVVEKIKENRSKSYKILSLPCASGEEPYTLLIFLLENNIENFEIIGADINSKVLEIAKTAIYPKRRVMYVPQNILEKYFEKLGNSYMLKDEYKKNIKFIQQNIFDHSIYSIGKFDFIFCRNLFIYFDDEKREEALKIFRDLLHLGGYLILGHADIVKNIKGFEKVKYNGLQILKKI